MTDEAVSRRRENAAFFLRILAFALIFTLISCAVLYVLTPKYDYDVCCSEYERTVGELGLQRV